MHLRRYGQRDYQAVFLAHSTSELGILSYCHILHTCKATENNKCVVTHNNRRVYGAAPVLIEHGDYIRVELMRKDNLMEKATLLSTMEEDYTQNDRSAFWPARRMTIGQTQQGTRQLTRTTPMRRMGAQSLHEAYWFAATIFIWIFVPMLILLQHEHPPQKVRRRYKRERGLQRRRMNTIFFCSLLLLQHCHAVSALQTCAMAEPSSDTQDRSVQNLLTMSSWPAQDTWQLDHFQGLRPPGNPKSHEGHLHTALTITDHGRFLIDMIVQHMNYESTALQIRERLLNVARPLRAVRHSCEKVQPQILNLERALFHPPMECTDDHVSEQMPQEHTSTCTLPQTQGGGSNAPINSQRVYGMFVGEDVLDDDKGLIVEWPALPTRRPTDFLKDLPDEYATLLSRFADPIDAHDDILHIYTDGSASKYDGDTRSAWAFIVFKCKIGQEGTDSMHYVDWFGNITQDDPMHSQWTGAMEQSSRSGEGEAIAWAILWALQRHPPCKIIIHSDTTSVLSAPKEQWIFPTTTIFCFEYVHFTSYYGR